MTLTPAFGELYPRNNLSKEPLVSSIPYRDIYPIESLDNWLAQNCPLEERTKRNKPEIVFVRSYIIGQGNCEINSSIWPRYTTKKI